MPIDRFYCSQHLQKNSSIELSDQEFHHLAHVTRTKEGDKVEIVNGQGQLGTAEVASLSKKRATLQILSLKESPPSKEKMALVQAIPRINRLDTIVEKGTELGMTELWLFPGEKSDRVKLTEQQLHRLYTVAISAMKQCGRLYLPKIELRPGLLSWDKLPSQSIYGDLRADAPSIASALEDITLENAVYCFIGPESGFTDREIAFLREHGSKGVSLHENILRTDTAAIVALAQVYEAFRWS